MNRLLTVLGVLAGLSAPALVVAQGEKPPAVKEIMAKLNKGPNSLCPTLGKELRADEPAWEKVEQDAKQFAGLADALAKAHPPRGEAASWEKLTKAYAESAKALEAAAGKRDKAAAQAAHKRLGDMQGCKACHEAHRN